MLRGYIGMDFVHKDLYPMLGQETNKVLLQFCIEKFQMREWEISKIINDLLLHMVHMMTYLGSQSLTSQSLPRFKLNLTHYLGGHQTSYATPQRRLLYSASLLSRAAK